MKKLTETFNEIAVKKGDFFVIELEANASAGYLWEFNVTAGRARVVHNDMQPHSSDPMVIGGGGTERTYMKAEESGTIEIEARLVRPWDKTSVARQHRFKITVE